MIFPAFSPLKRDKRILSPLMGWGFFVYKKDFNGFTFSLHVVSFYPLSNGLFVVYLAISGVLYDWELLCLYGKKGE